MASAQRLWVVPALLAVVLPLGAAVDDALVVSQHARALAPGEVVALTVDGPGHA